MIIVGYALRPYRLRLSQPYRWARGAHRERAGLLVALQTDEGHVGWGEIAPPPHRTPSLQAMNDASHAVLDRLNPGPWTDFLAQVDAAAPDARTRCGLAEATYDAASRADGQPLATWLAADAQESVPVNALLTAETPETVVRNGKAAMACGYDTLKLKSDGHLRRDIERAGALRQAVGPGVSLRIDANGTWDPTAVARHRRGLEALGLQYVEQPFAGRTPNEMAAARAAAPFPVAWDESASSPAAIEAICAADAADAIVIKPQRLGGPDRALRAVELLAVARVPGVVTNSLETAVGRGHALAIAAQLRPPVLACGLATGGLLQTDVGASATPTAGRLNVSTGLGIDVAPSPPTEWRRLGDP